MPLKVIEWQSHKGGGVLFCYFLSLDKVSHLNDVNICAIIDNAC